MPLFPGSHGMAIEQSMQEIFVCVAGRGGETGRRKAGKRREGEKASGHDFMQHVRGWSHDTSPPRGSERRTTVPATFVCFLSRALRAGQVLEEPATVAEGHLLST